MTPTSPAAPGHSPLTDQEALTRAIDLATRNVAEGGGPFGAVVVRDGQVVSTGQNRVTRDLDPTAHAEVVAIRAACRALNDFCLLGCTLYASCEPCPLCLAATLWARIDRVVFAANRDDAARSGFDDSAFYDRFASASKDWQLPIVEENRLATSSAPFDAWLVTAARVQY